MSCALCIENMAQPLMRQLPHYDCVNYYANKLILKGDSNRLSTFFAKLDSLALWGDNEINIVHIGGSHIQAGVFPNRMRRAESSGCRPY